ncbi:MAG: phosphohistidine phosphatase SixA [Acidobacteria bacterium]|nr:phosphohistidine phosphatase SixA [Acidobacteriota bacterium]
MRLYVLRHGIAEDGAGMPDSQRQLTGEGREKLRKVMRQASTAGLQPDFIISSPYVRARQTAAIAVEELGFRGEVSESELLVPYASPHQTWEMLRERRHAAQTLVVGHNPHLSELLCLLTGAHAGAFEMKKAGLACLETFQTGPTPRAMLAWLMTPKSVGA